MTDVIPDFRLVNCACRVDAVDSAVHLLASTCTEQSEGSLQLLAHLASRRGGGWMEISLFLDAQHRDRIRLAWVPQDGTHDTVARLIEGA